MTPDVPPPLPNSPKTGSPGPDRLERIERLQERGRVGVTLVARLLQQPGDDLLEGWRGLRSELRERDGLERLHCVEECGNGVLGERSPSRQHLIEHHPQ